MTGPQDEQPDYFEQSLLHDPLPSIAPQPEPPASPVGEPIPAMQRIESKGPLRATVQVRHIDPWSTLKVTLVLAVALYFVWMFAVGVLYIVLEGMGVWDRLNNSFSGLVSESGGDAIISAGQVFGYSALVGAVNVVLISAFVTIVVFIYNQCADLVGGVEITLADPD